MPTCPDDLASFLTVAVGPLATVLGSATRDRRPSLRFGAVDKIRTRGTTVGRILTSAREDKILFVALAGLPSTACPLSTTCAQPYHRRVPLREHQRAHFVPLAPKSTTHPHHRRSGSRVRICAPTLRHVPFGLPVRSSTARRIECGNRFTQYSSHSPRCVAGANDEVSTAEFGGPYD